MLKHLGIEFTELELPLDTADYRERIDRYSPTRRVPVLMNGQLRVWDSLAICEYASELANAGGWPRDAGERAHARSISAEMHSGFQALRTCWPMNAAAKGLSAPLSEEARNDVKRIKTVWSECRDRHGKQGPWLFGGFSIADAMYAPVVLRFNTYGAELDGVSSDYVATVLSDRHVRAWIAAAN